MEQFKEAAATFERAVKRNVDDEFPWIYLASSYGHLGRIKDADDAIGSANDLRAKRGESFLNLESKTENHFQGEIDFSRSGGKQAQGRLRAGLTEIPALKWQNLATHFAAGSIKHWFEVEGATAIDVHTAKSLYDRGVIFVDARSEKNRNKEGWIPRSVSLPESRSNNPNNRRLTEKTLMNILDKTDEVVFYGEVFSGGEDAAFASAKSVNWGYENVFYFSGWWNLKESGFHGWKEAGYPVETGK
jgi:rhodanese-related sulfurtransferase